MTETALDHGLQAEPVEHFLPIRYWFFAVLLFAPWFLVLNHYSEGGRYLFGSRANLIASLAFTLAIAVACLRLLIGKPAGWGHVRATLFFLFFLILAFVISLEGVSVADRWLAGELIGKEPPGPFFVIFSSVFALYVTVAFVIVRWYAVLPLVGASYAVLSWAGTGGSRKARKPV